MKLSYLQSIDPCDPPPKLGRKVQPKKPDTDPFAHIKAFEIGEHTLKPQWFGVDLAKPAAPFIEDDSKTVSFADVGEMADGWTDGDIKPTANDVYQRDIGGTLAFSMFSDGVWRVYKPTVGEARASNTPSMVQSARWRRVPTAALEALR